MDFGSQLTYGGRPVAGFGLGVPWASDVDSDIADLDPSMVSLNTGIMACPQMAASDATLWAQAFERWQQLKSDWAFDKQGSWTPGPVYGPGIEARIQLSRNDYVTFQGKLAQACANLAPPTIDPTGSKGESNVIGDLKTAGKVIAAVAVTGVVVYAVYKGVQIAAPLLMAKK
jgi:hypothetical protein